MARNETKHKCENKSAKLFWQSATGIEMTESVRGKTGSALNVHGLD